MLEVCGLEHASLAGPAVDECGDLVWSSAMLSIAVGFCIVSVRGDEGVRSQLAFNESAVRALIDAATPAKVAGVSLFHPVEGTDWQVFRLRAVWWWQPDEDEGQVCFEFQSGGRTFDVPVEQPGALRLLWKCK